MNGFKTGIVAIALFALATTAHAGSNAQGPHGGIAAARGLGHSPGAASFGSSSAQGATGQSGQGGAYQASVVDSFQPWPEAEVRYLQKPHWEPYAGD